MKAPENCLDCDHCKCTTNHQEETHGMKCELNHQILFANIDKSSEVEGFRDVFKRPEWCPLLKIEE